MEAGRPVSETVNTIMKVIAQNNPDFWNPTEDAVSEQFARVYRDPTGNGYMAGLENPTNANKPAARLLNTKL